MDLTDEMLAKKPKQLSGGQRQRVAMGRAIVRQPQAFLMDEPLSNLDAKLRVEMRAEISRLQKTLEVTTIFVTHDQTEALTLGDHVAVMDGGTLQQVGSPETVYEKPANTFVAGFIGSPAMNLVDATIARTDGATFVAFAGTRLRVSDAAASALRDFEREEVIVGIRPEDLRDVGSVDGTPADRRVRGSVTLREAMGPEAHLHVSVGGSDTVDVVARVDAKAKAREGDAVELMVDTSALYFFDPATGLRVPLP